MLINTTQTRISLLMVLGLTFCLQSGCSSKPAKPSPEEQLQKLTDSLDNGGYASAGRQTIDSRRETWNDDTAQLDVVMTAPNNAGKYPLLVYLPSLGETADAAKLWRETWAKAGYAVFSMQPQAIGQALQELGPARGGKDEADAADNKDDESTDPDSEEGNKARRSKSARSSELRYLGHEYFAVDNLKLRMAQLFWAYQQLKTRAEQGQPLYQSADFSKVILVGYDLGAQTVAAVLGEDFKVSLPVDSRLQASAAILLSPSIDLAEGNVRNRFQKLKMPLLVISGQEDNDPYAISSASVRAAVWEFSPPGDKYLLSLTGNIHELLAGTELGGGMPGKPEKDDSSWFGLGGKNNDDYAGQPLQYGGGRSGGPGGGGPGRGRPGQGKFINAELGYKEVAAVLSASTAFLDAQVKNDEFAQYWLKDHASKWLDRAGTLKVR
ncbi:hypothetical protein KEF85_05510 [Methylomonas paludis]|uniref:Alpha/beta hydrolase n=1 Tax=Methylomonas paludis TaxID=1173101 RepID=A0A975R9Y6_9GAMM|nr:hypothetical protein [Methylomonas paludis]QWF71915.1 hypothetical protein KEF85_05510 [Methylomonas paludis]